MKAIQDIKLTEKLSKTLHAAQRSISNEFNVDRIILFGSVARGESDEESDVDILIVLEEPPGHRIRNRISTIILDINLEYDASLCGLVVDKKSWDNGPLSVLPIHKEVEQDGILI
ncbi:MAG: nucleotidyltransferase domain-containing protein [Nitrospirae bacterium]|nr:nucleotidyltransferase domain-containing protein [Nitrospirota bacterium]